MSGIEVIWNGVSSTTIPEFVCGNPIRSLLGVSRGSFVEIPGRAGSWYFGEQRGRRKIVLPCFVLSETFPTARRDALTAVADWLDLTVQAKLILGDEPTVYYDAVLLSAPDVQEWREKGGMFDLEFSVEPYSNEIDVTSYSVNPTSGVLFTHDFNLGLPTRPIIEVTPTDGVSISGFTLQINDRTIQYGSVLGTGTTVTINGLGLAVLSGTNDDSNVTGTYDPAVRLMSQVTGQFPLLDPGVNSVTFTKLGGDATAFTINVYYRRQFRK